MYQVYPRSFQDTNGDGVGDIPGILTRLDYIASLGVDGVWINPICLSAGKDVGYDVTDFRLVQPEYGTMEDMDHLIAAVHGTGL